MLSTKNLVNDYKQVDSRWIFENYCGLKEKLIGQDVKIKSLFNPKDKVPSMCIYLDKDKSQYKFKDFSTGKGGSAVDLVKYLKSYNFHDAVTAITEDYNDYVLHNNGGYNIEDFKEFSRYKVDSYKKRPWNTKDKSFWTPFNIGSKLLEAHNVFPLESYHMSKIEDEKLKVLSISGDYLYGYFTKEGDLYKIYQPKVKDKKFIKVKSYIQGQDQLAGHKYLIITSSLKDIMSLKSLKLQVDIIAPDSENCLIPKELISKWNKKYSKILVLFDNDEPGIKAMKKYKENYKTPAVLLTLAKDPSDAIKAFGITKVRDRLVPLINNMIETTI